MGLLGAGDRGGGDSLDGLAVGFQNLLATMSLVQSGVLEGECFQGIFRVPKLCLVLLVDGDEGFIIKVDDGGTASGALGDGIVDYALVAAATGGPPLVELCIAEAVPIHGDNYPRADDERDERNAQEDAPAGPPPPRGAGAVAPDSAPAIWEGRWSVAAGHVFSLGLVCGGAKERNKGGGSSRVRAAPPVEVVSARVTCYFRMARGP